MYHQIFSPPRQPGICDKCGGELYQRPDDTPDTQKRRISVYLEQTAPLINYYQREGILVQVDGTLGIEEIQSNLLGIIQQS
jgi:adenylate kinase